jgi:hypothetical protein
MLRKILYDPFSRSNTQKKYMVYPYVGTFVLSCKEMTNTYSWMNKHNMLDPSIGFECTQNDQHFCSF